MSASSPIIASPGPRAPAAAREWARRASSRASVIGGTGGNNKARTVSRRESVHEKMVGSQSLRHKRRFYGLEREGSNKDKFWFKHREELVSLAIILMYYVFGFLFYWFEEDWSTVDTLYFQTATLTTVGYGDFSPTSRTSRAFTMFYVFCGVILVGRILNKFGQSVLAAAEKRAKEQMKASQDKGEVGSHATSYYVKKIMTSLVAVLIVLFMGAIFYAHNENWDYFTALYFCVITTSTVGYGDTGLTEESSRFFATFYMLTSVLIVGLSIGNLAEVFLEIRNDSKRLKMMKKKLDFDFIRQLDDGEKDGIDKLDFVVSMLVNLDLVDRERDVTPWIKKFELLDKNKRGVIDFDETIKDLEIEQQQRILDIERQLKATKEQEDLLGNLIFFGKTSFSPNAKGSASAASPSPSASAGLQPDVDVENGVEMTDTSDLDSVYSLEESEGDGDDAGGLFVSNPMR